MTTEDARILTELYPLLLAMVPEDTPILLLFIIVDCYDFVFVYCCPLPLLVSIMFPLEPWCVLVLSSPPIAIIDYIPILARIAPALSPFSSS